MWSSAPGMVSPSPPTSASPSLLEADTFLNDQDTTPTRRVSPFDHTYHFTTGGTYNLPFGRGKLVNFGGSHLADEIFGGFVVNAIYQFQTGAPIVFTADIPLAPGATLSSITNKTRDTAAAGSGNPALNTAAFITGNSTTCPTTNACNGKRLHQRAVQQPLPHAAPDPLHGPWRRLQQPRCLAPEGLPLHREDLPAASLRDLQHPQPRPSSRHPTSPAPRRRPSVTSRPSTPTPSPARSSWVAASSSNPTHHQPQDPLRPSFV